MLEKAKYEALAAFAAVTYHLWTGLLFKAACFLGENAFGAILSVAVYSSIGFPRAHKERACYVHANLKLPLEKRSRKSDFNQRRKPTTLNGVN